MACFQSINGIPSSPYSSRIVHYPESYTPGKRGQVYGLYDENERFSESDIDKYAEGKVIKPPPNETGWKNVVKIDPGFMTTILVPFSLLDSHHSYLFNVNAVPGYVYHCHMLDHEDNKMMRPCRLFLHFKSVNTRNIIWVLLKSSILLDRCILSLTLKEKEEYNPILWI